MHSEGPAHEGSKETKLFIRHQVRGHSHYTLTKNLATFCPCPENLLKAEINGLIVLTEGISRQHSIWGVAGNCSLLLPDLL